MPLAYGIIAQLQLLLDDLQELSDGKRLIDIRGYSQILCFLLYPRIQISRDDHFLRAGPLLGSVDLAYALDGFDTVDARHPDIRNNKVELQFFYFSQRLFGALCGLN